jgi:hypothetical protein
MNSNQFMKCCAITWLALFASAMPGCSSSITVAEWESSLDQYAAVHANNDMSFLRERESANSTRQFSIIGTGTPEKSTDINGVLLGRRMIGDRPWLVFVIGRVKQRQVEDIRLALRSDDARSPKWVISESASGSLQKYRDHRDQLWRNRHPDRESPPLHAFEFPAEEDVFQLSIEGTDVVATHIASGARWNVKAPSR